MSALVKITSWIFPEFKFDWLVDESKKNIPQELDFTLEGKNAEKVKSLFKDLKWLKVRIVGEIIPRREFLISYVLRFQVSSGNTRHPEY